MTMFALFEPTVLIKLYLHTSPVPRLAAKLPDFAVICPSRLVPHRTLCLDIACSFAIAFIHLWGQELLQLDSNQQPIGSRLPHHHARRLDLPQV